MLRSAKCFSATGAYDIPGFGPFAYCGIMGVCAFINPALMCFISMVVGKKTDLVCVQQSRLF